MEVFNYKEQPDLDAALKRSILDTFVVEKFRSQFFYGHKKFKLLCLVIKHSTVVTSVYQYTNQSLSRRH